MSAAKGPVLLIAGGCAAMLGAAALTVSLGSFFSDLPTTSANAAAVVDLPVKKVKTVSLTPKGAPATTPVEGRQAAPPAATGKTPTAVVQPLQARPQAPAADSDTLRQTDPRWARNAVTPAIAPEAERKLEAAYADQGDEQLNSRAATAASNELGTSGRPFAMLGDTGDEQLDLAPTVDDTPTAAPRGQAGGAADDEVSGRMMAVRDGVNMRSAPRSGSGVITVVPAGAKVALASGCKQWCRVSYKGRTGYVYRSFIFGGSSKSRSRRTAPQEAQAQQQPQTSNEAGLFGNPGTINNSGASTAQRAAAAQAAAAAAAKTPEKKPFVPANR